MNQVFRLSFFQDTWLLLGAEKGVGDGEVVFLKFGGVVFVQIKK